MEVGSTFNVERKMGLGGSDRLTGTATVTSVTAAGLIWVDIKVNDKTVRGRPVRGGAIDGRVRMKMKHRWCEYQPTGLHGWFEV